jgi:2-octaprenyl-6-methoxyphenol hydroxylase
MTESTRDALVVGGALAGSLAALALARLGLTVTLVEARAPAPPKPGSDGRSISLSLASVRVLQSLDLWQTLASEATPIKTVHVSEAGRFGRLRLTAAEMGLGALGQVVPAEALLAAIAEAGEAVGVARLSPATLASAALDGDVRRAEVRMKESSRQVATRLLVVADGARSTLRDAVGIGAESRDYAASAWVTTARAAHPRPGVAFERYTHEGTLAILPRAGDKVGVVWTLEAPRDAEIEALEPAVFLERVSHALGGRFGKLTPLAPLRHFPLHAVRAERQSAERAVVIGNAAHSLHPVAAQGFNLTVRDIATLAECVREDGEDAGAKAVLESYAQARRRDQSRTQAFSDLARRIGDWRAPLASPLRAGGFFACDLLRPLAHECARQGMGLKSRPLPALVRGAPL